MVKNLPANTGDTGIVFDPWVGKIPWRRKWEPTPGFLPGKSYGQRSLEGYSPWGLKVFLRMQQETLGSLDLCQ